MGTIKKSETYKSSGVFQRRKFLFANLLILKASATPRFDRGAGGVRMVKSVFRRKSIGTKVTRKNTRGWKRWSEAVR